MQIGEAIEIIEVKPDKEPSRLPEPSPGAPEWTWRRSFTAEPIRGHKAAYLGADGWFDPPGWGRSYQAESVAVHALGHCRATVSPDPEARCLECGFYAVPTYEAIEYRWRTVFLDVELSGIVVRHQFGWRGERQEVRTVWLKACGFCNTNMSALLIEQVYPSVREVPWLIPCCRPCARQRADRRQLSPQEASNLFGTEVRLWAGRPSPHKGRPCPPLIGSPS